MSQDKRENMPSEREHGKPVIVYILLLFTTALLLMGLSSLIHQRNNTEALGRLQSDLTAMQSVQDTQEKVIALQEERQELEGRLAQAQQALEDQEAAAKAQKDADEAALAAMESLYLLEQAYQAEDYGLCEELIAQAERDNLPAGLSGTVSLDGLPSPALRWEQLTEAVRAAEN